MSKYPREGKVFTRTDGRQKLSLAGTFAHLGQSLRIWFNQHRKILVGGRNTRRPADSHTSWKDELESKNRGKSQFKSLGHLLSSRVT